MAAAGVTESNLSRGGAASSSRALIRRPPGLPASVWSGGPSSGSLIPSRGEGERRFDYWLTNKGGGGWFINSVNLSERFFAQLVFTPFSPSWADRPGLIVAGATPP